MLLLKVYSGGLLIFFFFLVQWEMTKGSFSILILFILTKWRCPPWTALLNLKLGQRPEVFLASNVIIGYINLQLERRFVENKSRKIISMKANSAILFIFYRKEHKHQSSVRAILIVRV